MKKYFVLLLFACLPLQGFAFEVVNRTSFPITIKVNDICSTQHWGSKGLFDSLSRTRLVDDAFLKACGSNKTNCTLAFFDSQTCQGEAILNMVIDTITGKTKSIYSKGNKWLIDAHWSKSFLLINEET